MTESVGKKAEVNAKAVDRDKEWRVKATSKRRKEKKRQVLLSEKKKLAKTGAV
jgi:hypothetical protein